MTEVSTPRKYEVFSLRFPDSSRVTKILEAALSGSAHQAAAGRRLITQTLLEQ